jgi:hypothetical protein
VVSEIVKRGLRAWRVAVSIAAWAWFASGGATAFASPLRVGTFDAARSLIYVSALGCNCVRVYEGAHFKQVDEISGLDGPTSIATDASGNLWVVNSLANDVLAFHQGSKKPFETLPAPNGNGIVVGDDGTVYVASYDPATLTVFAPGAITATNVYNLKFLVTAYAVTLDARGNVYMTGLTGPEESRVLELAPRTNEERLLPGFFAAATGVLIDAAGNRVVSDEDNGATYVLAPGRAIPTRVVGTPRAARPAYSAFNAGRTRLYVGDTLHAELDVFDYTTGALLQKIPEFGGYDYDSGIGVATSPRAAF